MIGPLSHALLLGTCLVAAAERRRELWTGLLRARDLLNEGLLAARCLQGVKLQLGVLIECRHAGMGCAVPIMHRRVPRGNIERKNSLRELASLGNGRYRPPACAVP